MLNVRVVTREYLIAMKLKAFRKYKNDISDIVGILSAHAKINDPIKFAEIDLAIKNLYGGWKAINNEAISFIKEALDNKYLEKYYQEIRKEEITNMEELLDSADKHPNKISKLTADEVIKEIKKKL